MSVSDDEALVLIAVRDGARRPAEIKRPPAAKRNAAIASLLARGLIAASGPARKQELSLPSEAIALAATLQAPPVTRARSGASLAQVEELLKSLVASVARLEAKVDLSLATKEAPAAAVPPARLAHAILDAVAALDARHRFGGLVPLPELRRTLAPLGVERGAVDAALEQLEREYAIDLNIAQAPASVSERSAGIERPGRGLIYYVTRRSS